MKKRNRSSLFWLVFGIALSPLVIVVLIYLVPILFTIFVGLFTFFASLFAIFFGGAGLLILALLLIQIITTIE